MHTAWPAAAAAMGNRTPRYQLKDAELTAIPVDAVISSQLGKALADEDWKAAIRSLAKAHLDDAFSLPLLDPGFCSRIQQEVASFRSFSESSGHVSPGLLLGSRWYLNTISDRFQSMFDGLLKEVLCRVDEALFPEDHRIAYQQVYCINYEEGRDSGLKAHTDDSDLTINVFLGSPAGYEGAELLLLSPAPEDTACGTPRLEPGIYKGSSLSYRHEEVGTALLHPGDRWHAVEKLQSGSRWNLLIMALRNDAAWKRTFYEEEARHLSAKAESLAQTA